MTFLDKQMPFVKTQKNNGSILVLLYKKYKCIQVFKVGYS